MQKVSLEEIHKARLDEHRTPCLDNSSLEAKKTLLNEVVLQELEDPGSDAATLET